MLKHIHSEPVEMTSEGLSTGKFDSMVDEKFSPVEEMSELTVVGATAGTSQIVKVRLYSIDISRPDIDYAPTATLSIGNVPHGITGDFATNSFEKATLKTKFGSVTFLKGFINRCAINEEDGGKYSLVLDVADPTIAKS